MSQPPPASADPLQAPNSSPVDESDKVLALLSKPRLTPYKQAFQPASDKEHLGAYLWAQAVSASLHPFIGIAEVVLRNAIHESLSLQCSRGKSSTFAWYDRAQPNSLPLKGKSLEKVEALLCEGTPPIRRAVQPTPDAVVAELTFGFWPNVMEGLSQRYAPRTFSDVFRHHPHSRPAHWSREENKVQVVLRLKRLQDLRNRVCHFEPVWKPHWLGLDEKGNRHWSAAVQALRILHGDMLELVGWCSPMAAQAYKNSFGWNWFSRLCTTAAVQTFMRDPSGSALIPAFSKDTASPEPTPPKVTTDASELPQSSGCAGP